MDDGSLARWRGQSDPFGEDFYLVPHDEEIRARAEQVLRDNRDAIRHFVELAIWEASGNPDHLKVLIPLLWHWDAVDPAWISDASFMTVGDVRDIAESQPLMTFPCLDCGMEIVPKNTWHRTRMQRGLESFCGDGAEDGPPAALLCEDCQRQRAEHDEWQRRLDDERYRSLLADYRGKPYADRRKTREWAVLKRQIHRRDGYRCRLCGDADAQLHVHHRTYETYAEERLEDLITLCRSCHHNFHFWSEAS